MRQLMMFPILWIAVKVGQQTTANIDQSITGKPATLLLFSPGPAATERSRSGSGPTVRYLFLKAGFVIMMLFGVQCSQ